MRIQNAMAAKLSALRPQVCDVDNESAKHNVPPGSESHFKVTIVAEQFCNKPRLARHRMVNALLADELAAGVHALALHLFTPDEWRARNHISPTSPPCLGGAKTE